MVSVEPISENAYSIVMGDDASIRNNTGVPAVTIGFEQKGSSPILYVPFSERNVNLGSLAANEANLVYVPIMNRGNARLITETVSNGSMISIPAIGVEAQTSATLAAQVTPEAESSFKESITLKSNGGKADLTFIGTTYQVRKASTVVNLAEAGSLWQVSPDVSELSISGWLSHSDWSCICANFKNLRYLDLSDARIYSNYFPDSDVPMACASTLERLCLPANMEYLESGFLVRIGITMLRDIVLPPGFVGIRGGISDWSSFSSLENLISLALEPASVDKEFLAKFTNVYVPKNAVKNYQEDHNWSQSNLSVITEKALNGDEIGEFSLEFIGDGNQYTSGLVIDWNKEVTKTQLLYPAKPLNIPKGTLIKSIKLRFKLWGDRVSNGTMKILCAEKNHENVNGFITDGQVCYEGSDNLNCSIMNEAQFVTYEFKQPYEYKGEGDFVLYFESHRPSDYANNTQVNTAFNEIEDIHCWCPWDEGSFYETDQKPDITLNAKLNSEEPYLFISLKIGH